MEAEANVTVSHSRRLSPTEIRLSVEESNGAPEAITCATIQVVSESPPNESSEPELPEYTSVMVQESEEMTDGGRDRVHYENLPQKDVEVARERALITEAPPTYRQLFGEQTTGRQKLQRNSRSEQRQSLFHKLKERLENNKLASTFVVSGGLILLLSLPVSMIIIGGLNIGLCLRQEIPLYLLVAGFILVADIIYQLSMCIGIKKNTNHKSIYRTLRVCDCLAVFLFIWLLVGTYWVFTVSIARSIQCGDRISTNDLVVMNTTALIDSDEGTRLSAIPQPTPAKPCPDCDNYVYSFTAFVIMFQYIGFLICFVACCSIYFKKHGR